MTTIHWYPGHMHKAQKEMRQMLSRVDLFIEVLDARIPFSSENPMLAEIRADKPTIKILTKLDYADPERVEEWQAWFEARSNTKTLALSLKNAKPESLTAIPQLCYKLADRKFSPIHKIKVMVAGIPNVGKSTLINRLTGETVVKTGNEPAITKRQQNIQLTDDIDLIDTPGVLWPKQALPQSTLRLAATGAIKNTALDFIEVAFYLLENLLANYPESLLDAYRLEHRPYEELEFLETLGEKKGTLNRGGRVDLNRISEIVVRDYRNGLLGDICLETPAMIDLELEQQRALDEAKARKKAGKKKKRR